jgi:hypothetical protein
MISYQDVILNLIQDLLRTSLFEVVLYFLTDAEMNSAWHKHQQNVCKLSF